MAKVVTRGELKKLLAAHMMRSVSDRYALLLKVGCSLDHVARYNLDKTPDLLVDMFLGPNGLRYWDGSIEGEKVIEALINEPLPEGIVIPES